MKDLRRVVLAAGGTAGHVFPAVAILRELQARGVDVRLFSDDRGLRYVGDLDRDVVDIIESGGLVSGPITKRLGNARKLVAGGFAARRLLKNYRPDLVIGLGGYASVTPILAASRLGIPTVLHEQNSVMGAANKFTARNADAVALTFDPTEGARGTCHITGNVSRRKIIEIGAVSYPTPEPGGQLGILVMGGSQGARSISERVPAALAGVDAVLRGRLTVVHQARSEDHNCVTAAYANADISARVVPFVDVPATLPSTHLVIARSGATTVCDIAVARRPAIYLPLLTHSDLQQVKNAAAVVDVGGAEMQREDEREVDDLTAAVSRLLGDTNALRHMADAARTWSRPDAIEAILALL